MKTGSEHKTKKSQNKWNCVQIFHNRAVYNHSITTKIRNVFAHAVQCDLVVKCFMLYIILYIHAVALCIGYDSCTIFASLCVLYTFRCIHRHGWCVCACACALHIFELCVYVSNGAQYMASQCCIVCMRCVVAAPVYTYNTRPFMFLEGVCVCGSSDESASCAPI